MRNRINVVLICGGKSTEHEVSIRSARSIFNAINNDKYNVIPVGIAKSGAWTRGENVLKVLKSGSQIKELDNQSTTILPDPNSRKLVAVSANRTLSYVNDNSEINVVFPVLHGPLGEDGTIQGLLEMANVAYVGCGVLGSALGMDKIKQKEIFKYHHIPVVDFTWFRKSDWDKNQKKVLSDINRYFADFYPLFVKPANTGSSVGISKVHQLNELEKAIINALKYDIKVLVEKGMEGISEIETSVLGNDNPEVSICGEILPKDEFYSYDAKYIRTDTECMIPADIDKSISDKIREYARRAFLIIDGAGMTRADFFLDKSTGEIWLNELNTIPGFTSISMYPKLWEKSGISYPELIDKLITLALEKWQDKQKIRTSLV
jgi:D-alanine-D-alanine ligase